MPRLPSGAPGAGGTAIRMLKRSGEVSRTPSISQTPFPAGRAVAVTRSSVLAPAGPGGMV